MKDKHILVVDDDINLLNVIKDLLEISDYNVMTAHSGNTGIQTFEEHFDKIHLIISDIKMPDGDGIYLLQQIREKYDKKPHIILQTGFAEVSKEEALSLGANEFLNKPVKFEILEELVQKYLQLNHY